LGGNLTRRRLAMIKRFFRDQRGQLAMTELVILLAIIVSIAWAAISYTGDTTLQIDSMFQTELKGFFIQGD